jgi:hypothetical protein
MSTPFLIAEEPEMDLKLVHLVRRDLVTKEEACEVDSG